MGGMCVIYKAEGMKLKRTVALKFLLPELSRDPDTKVRFLHEIRAAHVTLYHDKKHSYYRKNIVHQESCIRKEVFLCVSGQAILSL